MVSKSNTGLLRYTLFQKFDVHGARLAPELIDQFVEVITPIADYSYRWKLNTGCKKSKEARTVSAACAAPSCTAWVEMLCATCAAAS